jgi:hypothetical protein
LDESIKLRSQLLLLLPFRLLDEAIKIRNQLLLLLPHLSVGICQLICR